MIWLLCFWPLKASITWDVKINHAQCTCYNAKHFGQIHWTKKISRMHSLAVMLFVTKQTTSENIDKMYLALSKILKLCLKLALFFFKIFFKMTCWAFCCSNSSVNKVFVLGVTLLFLNICVTGFSGALLVVGNQLEISK